MRGRNKRLSDADCGGGGAAAASPSQLFAVRADTQSDRSVCLTARSATPNLHLSEAEHWELLSAVIVKVQKSRFFFKRSNTAF